MRRRPIPPIDLRLEWSWYLLGPFVLFVILYRVWRARHPAPDG